MCLEDSKTEAERVPHADRDRNRTHAAWRLSVMRTVWLARISAAR